MIDHNPNDKKTGAFKNEIELHVMLYFGPELVMTLLIIIILR